MLTAGSARLVLVAGVIVTLAAACAVGAASPTSSPPASSAAPSPTSSSPLASPSPGPGAAGLAPAGPAPGNPSGGSEDDEASAAAALAQRLDCRDVEGQEPLPAVAEQLSCRLGADRVYVLTFASSGRRDTYLAGLPVVTGGWDVVGPTWIVHVDGLVQAQAAQARLHGVVRRARAT